ncbi:MAG: nitrous oxide reductase accessory protein NosL [Cyclobacteriaceae bacterium]
MKHTIWNIAVGVMSLILVGCSISTEPIVYGEDGCHFCKMGIVDQRYGAELVTDKGKIMKFDAIECMVNFQRSKEQEYAFTVVNTLDQPATLQPAVSSYFLVSKKLPSPMGMYLTGFTTLQQAVEAKKQFGGNIYSWDELNEHFDTIKNSGDG